MVFFPVVCLFVWFDIRKCKVVLLKRQLCFLSAIPEWRLKCDIAQARMQLRKGKAEIPSQISSTTNSSGVSLSSGLGFVLCCVQEWLRCFTLTELLLRRSINGYWKTVEETSKNAPGLPVIDKPSTHITCHTALYATETTKISPNSYKYRPGGP